MTVVTVTVNQWHIKDNSTNGTNKPVICVNRYKGVAVYYDEEGRVRRAWGNKVGETEHHHDYEMPAGFMVYDPVNKTPCGASCWMEYEECCAEARFEDRASCAVSPPYFFWRIA